MISTILVEHPWLTAVALVALVLIGPVVGALVAGRPRAAYVLLLVSLVPVLLLTLWPTSSPTFATCAVEWSVPTLGKVELMANIVLFVPPVLLLAVAWRRPVAAVLVGSVASVAIEAVQAAIDIGRSCSTNDWLSNSIGAVLGGLLAAAALVIRRRWDLPTSAGDPLG